MAVAGDVVAGVVADVEKRNKKKEEDIVSSREVGLLQQVEILLLSEYLVCCVSG